MIYKVLAEGLGLGILLVLVCAFGIRNGAVNMVFLYHEDVQKRCIDSGLITPEKIKKNQIIFKACCIPFYFAYILIFAYAVNGARGFLSGFWQMFAILSVMNIIDRIFVDGLWVGHTNAWIIPGTEDLRPYITARDKCKKWLFGTVGMALLSAVLSGIMLMVTIPIQTAP